jgi:hypothetical protein
MSAQPVVVMIKNTELPDIPQTDEELFRKVQELKDVDEEEAYQIDAAGGP